MPDDLLDLVDTTVLDDYSAQVAKVLGAHSSSESLEADIAHAVELYLVAWSKGSSPDDFRTYQSEIQSIIQQDLGADNAASVAADLDLLLRGDAQHSPDLPSAASGSAAEPVHLASGQFIHTVTDFMVSGAGIDFTFSRTYKSGAFYMGPLGASWDHAYNLWLRDNDSSVTVTTGRLLPVRYVKHEVFPYYVATGDDNIVTKGLDGAFEQQSPDGRVIRFKNVGDADGTVYRAVRITDRAGNQIQLAYDDQNRLGTAEVNQADRLITFSYDDQSRIAAISLFTVTYLTETGPAPVTRTWTYQYDDFSDLIAVIGPATDEFPAGRTTQYTYSSSSSFPQRQHDLLAITDPNGCTYLENEFGSSEGTVSFGRVVRQRVGNGVFLFDYADVVPDTAWTFSDEDLPSSCVTLIERDGHPVRYVLNAMGNILAAQETIAGVGEQQIVRRYAYDGDGRLTATLSPEGRLQQTLYGREYFYNRAVGSGNPALPMWQDQNLSASEHARFANVISTIHRSTIQPLSGLLDDLAIYGNIFPPILGPIGSPDDIIIKRTYEDTFQQLATISDPRFTASPDPGAPESQDPNGPYSKHLTVTQFNADPAVTPAAITYPDMTYPAPLPNGSTGIKGARKTFDAYDAKGRLLQCTEPEGNVFAYGYFPANATTPTTEGFLASVTAGAGVLDLKTRFDVNEAGQVVAATDPLGNTTRYAIDSCSLVRQMIPPIPDYEVHYTYDGNAQVVSRTTAIIDPDGSVAPGSPETVTFSYNQEMKPVLSAIGDRLTPVPRQIRRVYDPSNRLIRIVKPRGNSTCYEYDERSLLARTTRGCCAQEASTAAFRYDLDETAIAVTDARGYVTTTNLDVFGRSIGTTDALGNLQRTDYDKLDNVLIQRLFGFHANDGYVLLRRTEYLCDERGQLIRARRAFFQTPISTADPWKQPDAEFNIAWQTGQVESYDTLVFRDGNLRVFRLVNANGNASTFEFDAADRRVAMTDPAENVTRTTYDGADNIQRQDRYLVDGVGVTQAVISTVHDYDALNRLTGTTDGAGNRIARGLDSRDLLRTVTDALGHAITYDYNGFRDQVAIRSVLLPLSSGGVAVELTTTRSYDENGNVATITDANGNRTSFEYDALDRLIGVINPDGTSRSVSYDSSGNLTNTIDEEGVTVSRTYDAIDRLTGIQVLTGATTTPSDQWAQFVYDGADVLAGHANPFVKATLSCDSLGRCFQEILSFGAPLNAALSPLTLAREFDGESNQTGLGYPSGQALQYDFGPDDRFLRLRSTANASPYPGDPGAASNRTILQNRRAGNLVTSTALGNGVTIATAYDATGRRIADDASLPIGPGLVLQQLWDGADNRVVSIESYAGAVNGRWHGYDSTNRFLNSLPLSAPQPLATGALAPPIAPVPVASFQCQRQIDGIVAAYGVSQPTQPQIGYDAAGNRTSQQTAAGPVIYQSNVRNEYLSVGLARLAYDRAGRLATDTRFAYSYNFRGQLVQAEQPAGQTVLQIFHDALGRTVGMIEGGRTRLLICDGPNVIESYDNGVLSAIYLWEDRDKPRLVAASGEDQYLIRDVLDTIRLTADSQGAVTSLSRYDDFGNLLSGQPAGLLGYGGKWFYDAIGWYDYRARQYMPTLGRFAQPDPAGFIDGADLYTFVGNNPLSAVDPGGTDRQQVSRAAVSSSGSPPASTGTGAFTAGLLAGLGEWLANGIVNNAIKGPLLTFPSLLPDFEPFHLGHYDRGDKDEKSWNPLQQGLQEFYVSKTFTNSGSIRLEAGNVEAADEAYGNAGYWSSRSAVSFLNLLAMLYGPAEGAEAGLEGVARLPRPAGIGRKLSVVDHLRRFFVQDTSRYPSVRYSWGGKFANWLWEDILHGHLLLGKLEQGHIAIYQRWARTGGQYAMYPNNPAASAGLKRIADAGANLFPLPARLNRYLGRPATLPRLGTAATALGIYGGLSWELHWAYSNVKQALDEGRKAILESR